MSLDEKSVFEEITLPSSGEKILIDGQEVSAIVSEASFAPAQGGDGEFDDDNAVSLQIAIGVIPPAVLKRRPRLQVRGSHFTLERFQQTRANIEIEGA